MHILVDLLSLGSAEAYIGWGGKLNSQLMASCVRNICAKNYENLIIGFQDTVENVGDVFFGTQCSLDTPWSTFSEIIFWPLLCSEIFTCAVDWMTMSC